MVKSYDSFVNGSVNESLKVGNTTYIKEKDWNKISKNKEVKDYPNPQYKVMDGENYLIIPEKASVYIKKLDPSDIKWFCLDPKSYMDKNIYQAEFYNTAGKSGLLKDTMNAPLDIFCDISHGNYSYDGPISKKYHTVPCNYSSMGSYGMIIEEGGLKEFTKTLKELGFTVHQE